MLLRSLAGYCLQLADPLAEDRLLQVDFLADYLADLFRENGVVEPTGYAVI
jgi:hypothetical protein